MKCAQMRSEMKLIDQDRVVFLDGLRGWAAFVVLLYHIWVDGFPLSHSSAELLRHLFLFNGNIAVCLFFIISGFALTSTFFKTGSTRILRQIMVGRYFRLIIPIGVVSTIFYAILQLGIVPAASDRPDPFTKVIVAIPSIAEFAGFHFMKVLVDYNASQSVILPLWTMQYEYLGSLGLIVFLLVFENISNKILLLIAGLLVASPISVYCALMFFGALLAHLHTSFLRYNCLWVGLIASALFLAMSSNTLETRDYYYAICASALFIVVLFIEPISRRFSNRLSQTLGKISFPLYLVHGPIMWTVGLPLAGHLNQILINSLLMVLSLLAAFLLIPVERFAVSFSRNIARSALPT